MSPQQIIRVYDEARTWGKGPLDATERAAALAICGRAIMRWPSSKTKIRADAKVLLAMCGLLRKDGPP